MTKRQSDDDACMHNKQKGDRTAECVIVITVIIM